MNTAVTHNYGTAVTQYIKFSFNKVAVRDIDRIVFSFPIMSIELIQKKTYTGFLFDRFGFGYMAKYKQNLIYWFGQIQTGQTGRPTVHDPFPSR